MSFTMNFYISYCENSKKILLFLNLIYFKHTVTNKGMNEWYQLLVSNLNALYHSKCSQPFHEYLIYIRCIHKQFSRIHFLPILIKEAKNKLNLICMTYYLLHLEVYKTHKQNKVCKMIKLPHFRKEQNILKSHKCKTF